MDNDTKRSPAAIAANSQVLPPDKREAESGAPGPQYEQQTNIESRSNTQESQPAPVPYSHSCLQPLHSVHVGAYPALMPAAAYPMVQQTSHGDTNAKDNDRSLVHATGTAQAIMSTPYNPYGTNYTPPTASSVSRQRLAAVRSSQPYVPVYQDPSTASAPRYTVNGSSETTLSVSANSAGSRLPHGFTKGDSRSKLLWRWATIQTTAKSLILGYWNPFKHHKPQIVFPGRKFVCWILWCVWSEKSSTIKTKCV